MRITWKDGVATVAVAGAVGLYIGFLAGVDLPLVSGPRALAGAVLLLGLVSCALGGSSTMDADRVPARGWTPVFGTLGTATLIAGLSALITGNTAALAIFVAGTASLWLVATTRHAFAGSRDKVRDSDLHRLIEEERRKPPR